MKTGIAPRRVVWQHGVAPRWLYVRAGLGLSGRALSRATLAARALSRVRVPANRILLGGISPIVAERRPLAEARRVGPTWVCIHPRILGR